MKPLVIWRLVEKDLVSNCGRFEIRQRLIKNPKSGAMFFQPNSEFPESRVFLMDHDRNTVHVFLADMDATQHANSIVAQEGRPCDS